MASRTPARPINLAQRTMESTVQMMTLDVQGWPIPSPHVADVGIGRLGAMHVYLDVGHARKVKFTVNTLTLYACLTFYL